MKVDYGNGKTKYGPGVEIKLTGEDVAKAIYLYLFSKDVKITGSATIKVNDDLCRHGIVYVDPSGYVMNRGVKLSGRDVMNEEVKLSGKGKTPIHINKSTALILGGGIITTTISIRPPTVSDLKFDHFGEEIK